MTETNGNTNPGQRVGADAMTTHCVAPNTIVAGVPARVIKHITTKE